MSVFTKFLIVMFVSAASALSAAATVVGNLTLLTDARRWGRRIPDLAEFSSFGSLRVCSEGLILVDPGVVRTE